MDNIYYEKVLNRIIQGRLRIKVGDLVLYIYEPEKDLLEESYEIYEEAKNKAYFAGSFINEEILELLLKNDMWSPFDDRRAEEIVKEIEELKVRALSVFYRKKELAAIKRNIRNLELQQYKLRQKKLQLDHLTCEGAAKFAMQCWLTQNTTFNLDNTPFDFSKYSISYIMERHQSHTILPETFRKIARSQQWRSMWNSSKKRSDVFGKPSSQLDQNQLNLTSYSMMYDNVYENPEAPKDEIIDDDDCLDGWFIKQRRKIQKEKKQSEIDSMISNKKIANSQEIFLVANSNEEAGEIYDLNNDYSRSIVRDRQRQITSSENGLNFKDLSDVSQQRMISAVNTARDAVKSRGR